MIDLMPAAGWRQKNNGKGAISLLANSAITTVHLGSYVPEPRIGNQKALGHRGDIFWVNDETGDGLNSIGLRDTWGLDGLVEHLPAMKRAALAADKKLRISFAGFCGEDFARFIAAMYSLAPEDRPDEIELNFGCPNAAGHGIISYNPTLVRGCMHLLVEVMPRGGGIVCDVKVSPFLGSEADGLRDEVCGTGIAPFLATTDGRGIRAVVTANTEPNIRLDDDDGHPRIAAEVMDGEKKGAIIHAGGRSGGDHMLEIACREAAAWDQLLLRGAGLVLVGGVRTGEHAARLISAGGGPKRVFGIQVGTAFFHCEDPRVFTGVAFGLDD